MAAQSLWQRIYRTLASVRTGVILLIVVGVVSALGTFILQRPITEPEKMQAAYSPQLLQWLDKLGLTDVYHSSIFLALMILLAASIILVSIDRFPRSWKTFTKPYRKPEDHFRATLPIQAKIPVRSGEAALALADNALRKAGFRPQRVNGGKQLTIYAEKNRFSVFAVYVVHASLLLILAGGIVDALFSYRGFVALQKNQVISELELRGGIKKSIPFFVRCDGAGQENYADGTPKKWWSKLAVLENGKEVLRKEIVVNDPLVYRGIRFYQASYGSTGQLDHITIEAHRKDNPNETKNVVLTPTQVSNLDDETTVQLVNFIPDFVVRDNQIYTRSNDPVNPAIQLAVNSAGLGERKLWLFPQVPNAPHVDDPVYDVHFVDLKMGTYTGLEVSREPGQWAVWTGCVLMAIGLVLAFYSVHRRFWAVPISDRQGNWVLWLGTQADKNRDHYQDEFKQIVEYVRIHAEPVEEMDPQLTETSLASV